MGRNYTRRNGGNPAFRTDKLAREDNPPVNSNPGQSADQQWSPIAGSPEAILAGLNDRDARALDQTLHGLAGISKLTPAQREAVADTLFGFVLAAELGADMNVDIADDVMARIRQRRAS